MDRVPPVKSEELHDPHQDAVTTEAGDSPQRVEEEWFEFEDDSPLGMRSLEVKRFTCKVCFHDFVEQGSVRKFLLQCCGGVVCSACQRKCILGNETMLDNHCGLCRNYLHQVDALSLGLLTENEYSTTEQKRRLREVTILPAPGAEAPLQQPLDLENWILCTNEGCTGFMRRYLQASEPRLTQCDACRSARCGRCALPAPWSDTHLCHDLQQRQGGAQAEQDQGCGWRVAALAGAGFSTDIVLRHNETGFAIQLHGNRSNAVYFRSSVGQDNQAPQWMMRWLIGGERHLHASDFDHTRVEEVLRSLAAGEDGSPPGGERLECGYERNTVTWLVERVQGGYRCSHPAGHQVLTVRAGLIEEHDRQLEGDVRASFSLGLRQQGTEATATREQLRTRRAGRALEAAEQELRQAQQNLQQVMARPQAPGSPAQLQAALQVVYDALNHVQEATRTHQQVVDDLVSRADRADRARVRVREMDRDRHHRHMVAGFALRRELQRFRERAQALAPGGLPPAEEMMEMLEEGLPLEELLADELDPRLRDELQMIVQRVERRARALRDDDDDPLGPFRRRFGEEEAEMILEHIRMSLGHDTTLEQLQADPRRMERTLQELRRPLRDLQTIPSWQARSAEDILRLVLTPPSEADLARRSAEIVRRSGRETAEGSVFKPCPRCGVTTAKIEGCNHMRCENCRTCWCFMCARPRDGQGACTDWRGHMGLTPGLTPDQEQQCVQQ